MADTPCTPPPCPDVEPIEVDMIVWPKRSFLGVGPGVFDGLIIDIGIDDCPIHFVPIHGDRDG